MAFCIWEAVGKLLLKICRKLWVLPLRRLRTPSIFWDFLGTSRLAWPRVGEPWSWKSLFISLCPCSDFVLLKEIVYGPGMVQHPVLKAASCSSIQRTIKRQFESSILKWTKNACQGARPADGKSRVPGVEGAVSHSPQSRCCLWVQQVFIP